MKRSIFFGTPTSRGETTSDYSVSLARASADLTARGVDCDYLLTQGYDVAMQRDMIATRFLRSTASHLALVDSDIGFPGNLHSTLLSYDKPLIGAFCPLREVNGSAIAVLVKNGFSGDDAVKLSTGFAFKSAGGLKFENGIASIDAIGAGFMIVARDVFDKIEAKFGADQYRPHNSSEIVKKFFWWEKDEAGELIPEDWGFCNRWRACGGEVFGYGLADMTHSGAHQFSGNMMKRLDALGVKT